MVAARSVLGRAVDGGLTAVDDVGGADRTNVG
jgi:hypothetical protein